MNEYDSLSYSSRMDTIEKFLTPSEKEQIKLILEGKCPHNQGWSFESFGHNSSCYSCVLCKKIEWY